MICPKCREDNPPTFRFCGMCGTSLEAPRPTAPAPEVRRPPVAETVARPANKQVAPSAAPSLLGLSQPGPIQSGPIQPSMESLREPSFSGLDSFFEPEEPKTGRWRILAMVLLLAALGGAAWWTYTNYLGAAESRKPETATPSAGEAPGEQLANKPAAKEAAPTPDAGSSQATVPPAPAPESHAEPASGAPAPTRTPVDRAATPTVETRPASPVKREASTTSPKASKLPVPAVADTGDAAFRKGEAYLYGRGAPENCDEAVKYLKAASAKSNAKARSAFGTMYATGHCVPRDLPTSYSWFALALRTDPNNQILEKDLSAIWNQMTPPERQLATRMKQ